MPKAVGNSLREPVAPDWGCHHALRNHTRRSVAKIGENRMEIGALARSHPVATLKKELVHHEDYATIKRRRRACSSTSKCSTTDRDDTQRWGTLAESFYKMRHLRVKVDPLVKSAARNYGLLNGK